MEIATSERSRMEFRVSENPSVLESTIATGTGMILGAALTMGAIHSPEYVIPATALAGFSGTIAYGLSHDTDDISVSDIAFAAFAGGGLCSFAGSSIGLWLGDGMVIDTAIGGAIGGAAVVGSVYCERELFTLPTKRRNSLLRKVCVAGLLTSASLLAGNYIENSRIQNTSAQYIQTESHKEVLVEEAGGRVYDYPKMDYELTSFSLE